MPQILPFEPTTPQYRVGTTLDGTQFIFDVHWNTRDVAWYMDILDIEEDPIRMGIKIILGSFLGIRSMDPRFPGIMLALDTSGENRDAGLDDLGTPNNGGRVIVYYFGPEDWREVLARR